MTEESGPAGGRHGIRLCPFPFSGTDVVAVVTTRHGGVSTGPYASLNLGDHVGDDHAAVAENRRRLCEELGTGRLTVADQQHGARVAVIGAALAGRGHDGQADARAALPATDAMVTDLPGVALGVLVADCAPVVLYDPVRRAAGVAHCGRAGTLLGVAPAAIAAMAEAFGSRPADLLVGIGPALGCASHEIGEAEAAQVAAVFPDAGVLHPTRPGHATFDLAGALRLQLRQAGVPSGSIHVMEADTRTSTADFFSHRAQRPCGRFMAVVTLRG